MVETSTDTQKEMGDKITSLRDLVGKINEDLLTFGIKLGDIQQHQKDLAKQQETCQNTVDDLTTKQDATEKVLEELTTNQETCQQTVKDLTAILDATDQTLAKLTTNQEICQNTVDDLTTKQDATEKVLEELTTNQETYNIQTKQAIVEVKVKQEAYQKQTHQRLDELSSSKAKHCSIPLDEGNTYIVFIYSFSLVLMTRNTEMNIYIH